MFQKQQLGLLIQVVRFLDDHLIRSAVLGSSRASYVNHT